MWAIIFATTTLITALPTTHVFLTPESLSQAQGVELAAQLSEETQVLIAQEPGGSMWYMPVAALELKPGIGIWYQRVEKAQKEYLDQRVLCLGYYRDGQWTVPSLSDAPVPWSGPNNIVMRRSPNPPTWGGFNQHQIQRTGDGFRMLYWDQPSEKGEAGVMLADSPDGIQWTKDPRGTVFTEHNDAFTVLKTDRGYYLYQTKLEDWPDKPYSDNLDKFRRVQSIRESQDFVTWTPQDVFLRPDAQDPPETEFYLMKAWPQNGKYLGILMKYFGDPNAPGKHSSIIRNELMVSADARTWQRPFRTTDIGFFTFADPFLDAGKLCFATWKDNGLVVMKYRPNRLVGVTAKGDGEFLTPALNCSQPALDADASKGWIEAVPLNEQGEAVPGATPTRVEGIDGEAHPLAAPNATVPYRFRLRLHNATVYAVRDSD